MKTTPKPQTILTPSHKRWGAFIRRLDKHTGECHNDHRFTRSILKEMGFDIERTLALFARYGGCCCDCEVRLNVECNWDEGAEGGEVKRDGPSPTAAQCGTELKPKPAA